MTAATATETTAARGSSGRRRRRPPPVPHAGGLRRHCVGGGGDCCKVGFGGFISVLARGLRENERERETRKGRRQQQEVFGEDRRRFSHPSILSKALHPKLTRSLAAGASFAVFLKSRRVRKQSKEKTNRGDIGLITVGQTAAFLFLSFSFVSSKMTQKLKVSFFSFVSLASLLPLPI